MINNNEKSVGLRVAVFVETVIIYEAREKSTKRNNETRIQITWKSNYYF